MAYKYNGKLREIRVPYVPISDAEAKAKFARYREAETHIYMGPAVRRRNPQPICGTYGGWSKHKRDKTQPCRDCSNAQVIYQRDYRERKRAA